MVVVQVTNRPHVQVWVRGEEVIHGKVERDIARLGQVKKEKEKKIIRHCG